MKFLSKSKDGGPESTVDAYTLIEIKSLFSIILLKFNNGSRQAFHTHAFNALSWYLKGESKEISLRPFDHLASYKIWKGFHWWPKFTPRDQMHKVISHGTTWVFTIRGPWSKTWSEYLPDTDEIITLTNGRKQVA